MSLIGDRLLDRIHRRRVRVGVVGLGVPPVLRPKGGSPRARIEQRTGAR